MAKVEKVPRGKDAPKVAKAAGGKPHDQLRGTALPRREEGPLDTDERRAAAEKALAALREKLKEIQPLWEDVVRHGSWDGGQVGQLAMVQSRIPRKMGAGRVNATPGEELTVAVDGCGPEHTSVVISCQVPNDASARPEGPDKDERFTVTLPPHYYPKHEPAVTKALMAFSDIFSDMHLCGLKTPIGYFNALGCWMARPSHSDALQSDDIATGQHGGGRRVREAGVSVDEVLASVSRIADPSTAAFHHERLGHFGRTGNAKDREKVRGWPGNARGAPAGEGAEEDGDDGAREGGGDEGGGVDNDTPVRLTRSQVAAQVAAQAAAEAEAEAAAAATPAAAAAAGAGHVEDLDGEAEPPSVRRQSRRSSGAGESGPPVSAWIPPPDSRGQADGMMPECTECNKPGPGCALHVYGTIKGEDHEAACVALLECALETQKARAHSDIFARQERADQKREEELEAEATRFRKNTALVFALRLVRKDLSQNQLRNFISEQNAQGINTMSGRRIFPSFDEVIAIYRELRDEVSEAAGIEKIESLHGEAGYWPLSKLIPFVLNLPGMRDAMEFPEIKDAIAFTCPLEDWQANVHMPMPGPVQPALTEIEAALNWCGQSAILNDPRNRVSVQDGTVHVVLFGINAEGAREQLRKKLVDCPCRPVLDLTLRGMIDAGSRNRQGTAGGKGQTIEGIGFKALTGLMESVISNFWIHLAFNGSDDHDNYNSCAQRSLEEKRQLVDAPLWVTIRDSGEVLVFRTTIEHGGDGACRRSLQGLISVAGQWKNENCTHQRLEAINRADLQLRPCEDRHMEDVWRAADGALEAGSSFKFGMITWGAIMDLHNIVKKSATKLWREYHVATMLPYFNRSTQLGYDLSIAESQSWTKQDIVEHMHVYGPAQRLSVLRKWLKIPTQHINELGKMKKHLLKVEEDMAPAAWLRTAEHMITLKDQDLKCEGPVAVLKRLRDGLEQGLAVLDRQRTKSGSIDGPGTEDFDKSVQSVLEPHDASEADLRVVINKAEELQKRADQTMRSLEVYAERAKHDRPVYPDDVYRDLKKMCVSHANDQSPYALYRLSGGEKGMKQLEQLGQGQRAGVTFPKPMMLGILHLFTIRGWGTILSMIGVLAYNLGCGVAFAQCLTKGGVPVGYYMKYGKLKFGIVKSKGHDSLRVMMDPDRYMAGVLEPEYRRKIVELIRLWSSVWFIVSNPHLETTFFIDNHWTPVYNSARSAAEDHVRRMCKQIDRLLLGLFGAGSVFTPTVHSVIHDVPKEFSEHRDLWFGNEQAIEACQPICRQLQDGLTSSKMKNTDTIIGAAMRSMAKMKLRSVAKRQKENLTRQKKHAQIRWTYVTQSVMVLNRLERRQQSTEPRSPTGDACRPCHHLGPFQLLLPEVRWQDRIPSLKELQCNLTSGGMTAVSGSSDRADGGGELGSEAAPAKKQKAAKGQARVTAFARPERSVGTQGAARRAAHAKVLMMYTGLNHEEAVARAALDVAARAVEDRKRDTPEQAAGDSQGESDVAIMPLDELVELVIGEDLSAEDDTGTPDDAPTMMDEESEQHEEVEVDNSPTGDWDAEEESEENEPMILEYLHSEEHNIVAYVHHAAITTCEINGEELRADQTKRWSVGDQVEGLYAVAQRRRWYFATVVAITELGETYTLQYEYVPDDSSSGQATVEGVVATQIRKRPGRMRGNTRKDDEMTTIAYKTTCKAQQGQVNKSAVTLGLVCAQANGAVQLAPLWLVQDVSADDAYRVVPDLPTLSVPHAAIVSGMYREPNHDFERDHRAVPFAVYEIALEVVSGIEDLAALRAA